jgi:hypothetical protein
VALGRRKAPGFVLGLVFAQLGGIALVLICPAPALLLFLLFVA